MRLFSITFLFASFNTFSQVEIFNASFQNGIIPSNFALVDNDMNMPAAQVAEYTSAWIVVADPENTSDSVAASTSYFENPGTASKWLITPPILLGSFGNYINWNAKSHDPSFPDDYLVLVSTTDTNLASFTDTIGSIEQENFEWTNREVKLEYDNQTIYVAFVNVTNDGFKLYIDDINIRKDDATSVNELNSQNFQIYPNPFNDIIQISADFNFEKIELRNLNGQLLLSTCQNSMDVSSLQSGYYIVSLNSNNQVFNKKVLKL